MVPGRPVLDIDITPALKDESTKAADKCRDYPKYITNKIIDMLYVRTDIADRIQRRKPVIKYT